MKIPVKDFTVIPALCPANFKDGCSPCRHAKLTKVQNPPISGPKCDFGYVECGYLEWFNAELKKEADKI